MCADGGCGDDARAAIKALLYWNANGYPTRIDSSPQSLAAYRLLAQNAMYNQPLP